MSRPTPREDALNLGWLLHNVSAGWRYRATPADVIRRLILCYSPGLPRGAQRPAWTIGFHYPDPIGHIRLLLRNNAGADLFILSEVFEHEHYRLPLTQPPATILDLGANIGLSTIYLARMFPAARLACVEPVSENVRVLSENLRLNGIDAKVIAAAADVKDGTVSFERAANDYGHKVAPSSGPPAAANFEVPALSVRSILRRLGWSRVGLVKIDIEGHETSLLAEENDWLNLVDAMCLEYHFDFAERALSGLATQFGFGPPRRLPSGIWLLER